MRTLTKTAGIRRAVRGFLSGTGSGGSGQALAEFAISFPFQLFLTFGLMQLMLLMISSLLVNYTSYRCARTALVYFTPDDPSLAVEKAQTVAQVLLSPIAFQSIDGYSNLEIPGWGNLRGSGAAEKKIIVEVSNPGESDLVMTTLTFKQQLLFPFVDRVFAMVVPAAQVNQEGRNFAGASESSGGIEVLDGKVHYLIKRRHVMKRDRLIPDVSPQSPVYNHTW